MSAPLVDDGGEPCQVRLDYGEVAADGVGSWRSGYATGSAPSFRLDGLTGGTSYRFRLVARNAAGETRVDGGFSTPSAATDQMTWVSPRPVAGPSAGWRDLDLATDGDRGTAATCAHALDADVWSPDAEFATDGLTISRVRFAAERLDVVDAVAIEVLADGAWRGVFEGAYQGGVDQEHAFAPVRAERVRLRFRVSRADVGLHWRLHEVAVLANERLEVAFPAASAVSPACIEGSAVVGSAVSATVAGRATPVTALSDRSFYLDAELAAGAPVEVVVDAGVVQRTASVGWAVTELDGADAILHLRVGDALLLRTTSGSALAIASTEAGCGPAEPRAVTPGEAVPQRFATAGTWTATALDAAGTALGGITVVVVDLPIPQELRGSAIACEIGYRRSLDVPVAPPEAADAIRFTTDSALLEARDGAVTAGVHELLARPLGRGDHIVAARIAATGDILGVASVAAFAIDRTALYRPAFPADAPMDGLGVDGNPTGLTTLEMRPLVRGLRLSFAMFAHRSTFAGGATAFSVATDGSPSSIGEPGFVEVVDPITGERFGRFVFAIVVPYDENSFCHSLRIAQER